MLVQTLREVGHVRNYETLLKRRDGAVFNANLTLTPYVVDDPQVWQTVLVDITQKKRLSRIL